MVDLTTEMAGLWAALGPAPAHRGRVIQFVSATSGEGVSTVAREYARLAAVRARKPVWLIGNNRGTISATAAAVAPARRASAEKPAAPTRDARPDAAAADARAKAEEAARVLSTFNGAQPGDCKRG